MKTCSIEIVTFTRGERLHTVTNGTLEEHPQGFTLFYTQESDPVCLNCRDQTVFMERQGESQLSAFFSTNDEGVSVRMRERFPYRQRFVLFAPCVTDGGSR